MDDTSAFKKNLAKQIRKIQGGLDQRSFARSLGVSQSTVSRWLAGSREPLASDLVRIAIFANCSVDRVLFGEKQGASIASVFTNQVNDKIRETVHLAEKIRTPSNVITKMHYKDAPNVESSRETRNSAYMFSDLVRQAIDEHGDSEKLSKSICNSISSNRLDELALGADPTEEECCVLTSVIKPYSSGELMRMAYQYKSNGHNRSNT